MDRVFLWSQSDLFSHQLINQYSHLLHSQLQVQGGVRQTVEENIKQVQLLNNFPILFLKKSMHAHPTRVRHMTKHFHITSKNICFCPKGYNDPKKTDLKNH